MDILKIKKKNPPSFLCLCGHLAEWEDPYSEGGKLESGRGGLEKRQRQIGSQVKVSHETGPARL